MTTYPADRLGVVCQTTVPRTRRRSSARRSRPRNPDAEVRFVDTVCRPTKDHQRSLVRLVERVEAVVVVGGRNSNNTKELVTLCRDRGLPVLHVQSAGDIDADWFRDFETVGLTAGTSTLDETIDEVDEALRRSARRRHRVMLSGRGGSPGHRGSVWRTGLRGVCRA